MTLEYAGPHNFQAGADHFVDVVNIDATRAVVTGNRGRALPELASLAPSWTQDYLDGQRMVTRQKEPEVLYEKKVIQGDLFYISRGETGLL